MSKSKIKLLAMIISCGMFVTSCEMDLKEIEGKLKEKAPLPEFYPPTSEVGNSEHTTSEDDEDIFEGIVVPPSTVAVPKEETISTEETKTQETIPATTESPIEETTQPIETVPEVTIPQTEPQIESPIDDIMVHATTKVNIRSGNTTDSIIIGNLELGEAAYRILSCDNNWDLVRTNDQIGYICRDYLSYTDETYETEYKHQIKNDIVLTTTELNMRDQPTGNSKQLNNFKKNTELEVVAEVDNGWLLVKYNGQLGYINSDYTKSLLELAQEQYPDLNLDDLGVQKVVYSNATLNIRKGNSTDYDQIGQLERFETVRVIGEYDDWYFILTNDHTFGFVSKEYTRDLEDTYVVVDKSAQQLYLYNNDELLYITPVTTGKDSTPSDTGLFHIYSKETDRYLTDGKTYNAHVDYWMPYNGGEGLHDAAWRSVFGTESYHSGGSHGCINIPPKITEKIYEKVKVGDTVIVHK